MRMSAAAVAFALLALSGPDAWPQSGRTIKLVVPASPGASTDFVARLSAEHISRHQGVTAVVENRAGAWTRCRAPRPTAIRCW